MNFISIRSKVLPAGGGAILALAGVFALSACATTGTTAPKTGWSRAPDISVYAAMELFGERARAQEILCAGRNPAKVDAEWRAKYGARQDWIAAAMTQRYGRDAVARPDLKTGGRARCDVFTDERWRTNYTRLLKLLELRLYPKSHWTAG